MPAIKQNNQAVKTEQLRSKKDAFSILDNQVKIFRTNSNIYQFQLWIKEEQKYVRLSLHTEDKEIAITKATERFIYSGAILLERKKRIVKRAIQITPNAITDERKGRT